MSDSEIPTHKSQNLREPGILHEIKKSLKKSTSDISFMNTKLKNSSTHLVLFPDVPSTDTSSKDSSPLSPSLSPTSPSEDMPELKESVAQFLAAQNRVRIERKGSIRRSKFSPDRIIKISFPASGPGITRGKTTLSWLLFGSRGNFNVSIVANGEKIITIHRHSKLGITETTTVRSGKTVIGRIKQKIFVRVGIRKMYKVYDAKGKCILRVFSPMLHPRHFFAQRASDNHECATIVKYYDESFDSNYNLLDMKFFKDVTPIEKALLLATMFLISMFHI